MPYEMSTIPFVEFKNGVLLFTNYYNNNISYRIRNLKINAGGTAYAKLSPVLNDWLKLNYLQ